MICILIDIINIYKLLILLIIHYIRFHIKPFEIKVYIILKLKL